MIALQEDAAPAEALRAGAPAGTAVLLGRGAALLRREDAAAVARQLRIRRIG